MPARRRKQPGMRRGEPTEAFVTAAAPPASTTSILPELTEPLETTKTRVIVSSSHSPDCAPVGIIRPDYRGLGTHTAQAYDGHAYYYHGPGLGTHTAIPSDVPSRHYN